MGARSTQVLPAANEVDDAIERVRKIFELQKVCVKPTWDGLNLITVQWPHNAPPAPVGRPTGPQAPCLLVVSLVPGGRGGPLPGQLVRLHQRPGHQEQREGEEPFSPPTV